MNVLLVFAITLVFAVLLSARAQRSILSTAVMFLLAGFLIGPRMLGASHFRPDDPAVSLLSELALFSVLFTDGMRVGLKELREAWHLPGRALLLGMPLTMLLNALPAHYLVHLGWTEAFLVGAVLSPTDPVFAAAIVGREEVPNRLRHLLNVESGLNDGLALPVVLALIARSNASKFHALSMSLELFGGIALGIIIPLIVVFLARRSIFEIASEYAAFGAFAIGLMLLALTRLTHANEFLAAFIAGITVASASPKGHHAFAPFGEQLTELFKLAALLVFGSLISPHFMAEIPWTGYLCAALILFVVRPLALGAALLGSRLNWREFVAAAWFGPKGFASVVYGLLILRSGIPGANLMFHLIAVVIFASIIAHSSTDVVIARWFKKKERKDDHGETTEILRES